jgi:hypothetical protein
LRFQRLGIGEGYDADRHGIGFSDLRGAESSRPRNNLEAIFSERPH